ncbi:hypothetical protein [Agromyces badenianii]|uniref:hypothetical protein n=1 Tax=Agromyces badenianii TaxID=2080742 RepID=UPI000D59E978|nr:hypothetical protein [Agromyces badenianii]PWC05699.1 hypothetical protein DCE94_05470 [Agromyces badenianii]
MQFSADFVALHSHQSDVQLAEREISRQLSADENGSGDAVASPEPVRRHRQHRALRLALR